MVTPNFKLNSLIQLSLGMTVHNLLPVPQAVYTHSTDTLRPINLTQFSDVQPQIDLIGDRLFLGLGWAKARWIALRLPLATRTQQWGTSETFNPPRQVEQWAMKLVLVMHLSIHPCLSPCECNRDTMALSLYLLPSS